MAVPLSKIVYITPRVLSGAISGLSFNGLFVTSSDSAPVDTLLKFNNASEVADYFGYDSPHHKAAVTYFNGYNNSLKKPSSCFFFRHVKNDAPAFLRGGKADNDDEMMANIRRVSNGSITLDLGPAELELTGLDFSRCECHSDAAQVLEDAINDQGYEHSLDVWKKAEVKWSSLTRAFQISAGVPGPGVSAGYASGQLADVMRLSEAMGAVLSSGAAARTYQETMNEVMMHTGNFVTYTTVEEVTSLVEAEDLAAWANNMFNGGAQFLYVWHTTDITLNKSGSEARKNSVGHARVGKSSTVIAGSGREIAEAFIRSEPQGVAGVYGDIRYAAFIMGSVASIDWGQPGSTITFAMKSQSGLEANVTDEATWDLLDELKLTCIADYASRNDNFKLSAGGKVYGSYDWIDTYVNSAWLNNELLTSIANGMSMAGRIPYGQVGYAMVRSWCQPVFSKGRANGVIDTGVVMDDGQKNMLTREAGRDISSDLTNNGYYMLILEAPADTRKRRESPPCQIWYTYGGAIHSLVVPVTTVA